eukprot:Skav205920  [mRNA]  locus=scaffold123:789634:789903:- [translate_table: standard]
MTYTHLVSSLSSLGTGHGLNLSSFPKVNLHAAFPATRPKTTQSSSELPPKRLLPWMPPAASPATYKPGITLPLLSMHSASTVHSKPPMV